MTIYLWEEGKRQNVNLSNQISCLGLQVGIRGSEKKKNKKKTFVRSTVKTSFFSSFEALEMRQLPEAGIRG